MFHNFFDQFADLILANPLFESLGFVFIFLWSLIPSLKTVPVEIFELPLLQAGLSPVALIIFASLGAITGDYILYLGGRGVFKLFKRKSREIARADHLLHKYRQPIFFFTGFLGVIGDAIVFVAGLERIGFRKILPYLIIGQFSRFAIGMLALLGIIQLPEFLGI